MTENPTLAIPILWGDGQHNDRAILRHLLKGGAAYDMRSREMIVAPTLDALPPGAYHVPPPGSALS